MTSKGKRIVLYFDIIALFIVFMAGFSRWNSQDHGEGEAVMPAPLKPGDLIAICSPAGPIDTADVYAARDALEAQGWRVKIMRNTLGRNGEYSGTAHERYTDLRDALLDPEVRAVVCSRGGYGVVHYLDSLAALPLEKDPKWVVGYSDISALHGLMASKNIASVHASMASHIKRGESNADNARLFRILRGERPIYRFAADSLDRCGTATGRLLGGNMMVIGGLIGTDFTVVKPGTILFIEDVDEPVYKMERILYQMRLAGVMENLAGLIVGQFTNYSPDRNHETMEHMVRQVVEPYDFPVAFNFPAGHVYANTPLIEGAEVTLSVTPEGNTLSFVPPAQK